MRIALAQIYLESDMQVNLAKTLRFMDAAADGGAELICFPELQLSPFFPQYPNRNMDHYLVDLDSEALQAIQRKSADKGLVTITNVYLRLGENKFDASPVYGADGQQLAIPKMVHIAQQPLFCEQDYYMPADDGFWVVQTAAVAVGVVICFDRHFPESIRSCALQGAQLIVIPTANIKAESMTMFMWEMRIAALQNGVFIAMCNRVGVEGAMDFAGESLVIAPSGDVLVKADDREQMIAIDIDLADVARARAVRPYLQLRRPHFYSC